ncbi:glycosyl hydrolase family 8 [Fusibacter ferrireducens]|uniref:Glycosyl hydrolases family 8 n=1 Tax=Fusibacter ferrireducens TaxID=2785058 RepID=A0ABR9ZQI3_9FIRM|nr:glycosyl hydrolase family 8 [Fusibacter ferrireducens]MBF4692723.1 hypothetical protein [Fusibacter ferrireducens]
MNSVKKNMDNQKHVWGLLCIGALVLILIGVFFFHSKSQQELYKIKDIEQLHMAKGVRYDEYTFEYKQIREAFELFFFKGLLPVTNLQELDLPDTASGDDILSESLGLMMLIAIKEQDKEQLDALISVLEKRFIKENGLLKWRVQSEPENLEIVNASIDDFRVVKALYEASELWHDPTYKKKAIAIGESLYQYCLRDNRLTSYDMPDSPLALMTYYDFKAMLYLVEADKKWESVLLEGLNEVYRHKVTDRPFYEKYNGTEAYRSIENLMILQHLYEIGLKDDAALVFIEQEIVDKGYYAAYSQNGEVLDDIESPAIYGIIAQVAKLAENESLYRRACEKIIHLACERESVYAWAFVDEETHIGYSFDHLMALLGL